MLSEYEKKQRRKIYDFKNREKIRKQKRKYRLKNKEDIKKKDSEYYQKNKEHICKQKSEYYFKNKDIRIKKTSQNTKDRRKIDKNYAIALRLRSLFRDALIRHGSGKIYSSKKYGIYWNKIIEHLKPFPENLSEYHIDHIKPLCSFNLTNLEEIKLCFAPENHQWLTIQENLSKGGKY